ncbi:alpha-1,2-Mannosidase [Mycena venus]|uniref:alpha-1,2-Mannosidase n=1 Tax=Mycena venus TaxID=2733690 RepID=A0A8H6TZ17_9AGAR|nr:alpha-1,2-Mannosidase [Mycena venus]
MRFLSILTLLGLCSYALAGSNRDAAEKIFVTTYNAYKEFAFGHDELLPISKSFQDDLGGWGASIVDAMVHYLVHSGNSAAEYLHAISEYNDNSLSWVSMISSMRQSTFRTKLISIRYRQEAPLVYLRPLYASSADYCRRTSSAEKNTLFSFKKQNKLRINWLFSWVGDNVINFGHIDFSDNTPEIAVTNIAEAGTLSLEWFTLSKFTGNATYGDLTSKSVEHIANLPAPLPGLAAQLIDPTSGQFADANVTWGGGSDSYFEYLLKYARLTNTNNNIFIDTWKTAIDSSIKTLLKTSTVGNHAYLATLDDQGLLQHVGSHLACFYAGNWLLGGKLVKNQTIIDIALELNDGCWNTYASTATGIGPEDFAFISSDGNFTGGDAITADQLAFYNQHGYYITTSDYVQRPEVLESNFYAWRITGDTKYLDRAAAAIASFNKFLPPPDGVAFACLNDVNDPAAGFIDLTESFWFAEVLKYLYLTFDDPEHISLDDYVFNTECHPLKAPPALDSYAGSGTLIPQKPFTAHSVGGPRPVISPI